MATSETTTNTSNQDKEDSFQLNPDVGDLRSSSSMQLNLNSNNSKNKMDGLLSKRTDLPDDLACFLNQQKQRQARLETTMRSFPTSLEAELEKQEMAGKRKRNTHEDPLSHRIIEKRRRDRMNNCLADLSRLIPSSYLKKGRGRIEKTEIIEMAIKHMKHLQNHPCNKPEGCELAQEIESGLSKTNSVESFRVGYHECLTESMHFLVEKEGLYAGNSFCVRLMTHLQKHYDRLGRASTSEIHSNVGRTWSGQNLPAENGQDRSSERNDMGVKSEYGFGSEESGYSSLKADDDSVVNMTRTDSERRAEHRTRSYSPDSQPREENERYRQFTGQDDKPSDLSLHGDSNENYTSVQEEVSPANLYKFKSNIRHRFDMQDPDLDYPPEKRAHRDSVSSDREGDRPLETESSNNITRSYSPGPSPQSHPSYDSFAPHTQHERLLGPSSRHQSVSSKADGPKPFTRVPPDGSEPLYNNPEIKTSSSPHPYSQPGSNFGMQKPSGQTLPIFALNTKGSYYVPLSIDSSILSPFLHLFAEDHVGPLHPITISVNFSGPSVPTSSMVPLPRDQDREWRQPRSGVIQHQQPSVIKHWREAP